MDYPGFILHQFLIHSLKFKSGRKYRRINAISNILFRVGFLGISRQGLIRWNGTDVLSL